MDSDTELSEQYSLEFRFLLKEIETRKLNFPKITQLKIDKWTLKFSEVCGNTDWEKNRNLHCILLLDNILNNQFESPYDKYPKDIHLPLINKSLVKAKLSNKFIEFIELHKEEMNKNKLSRNKRKSEIENKGSKLIDNMLKSKSNSKSMQLSAEDEIRKLSEIIGNLKEDISQKDKILYIQDSKIKKLLEEISTNEQVIKTIASNGVYSGKTKKWR